MDQCGPVWTTGLPGPGIQGASPQASRLAPGCEPSAKGIGRGCGGSNYSFQGSNSPPPRRILSASTLTPLLARRSRLPSSALGPSGHRGARTERCCPRNASAARRGAARVELP